MANQELHIKNGGLVQLLTNRLCFISLWVVLASTCYWFCSSKIYVVETGM